MQHRIEKCVTVLIVDDDPFVRKMVMRTLQPLGCRLLVASSGEEALRISKTTEGMIDLLLTDLVMPGMNGRELARVLKASRSSLEVVFMSGYPDDIIANRTMPDDETIFIRKPFPPGRLRRTLLEIFDKRNK